MMDEKFFETALGIAEPWHVVSVDLDAAAKTLTVGTDFTPGSRFAVVGEPGVHPVHDTVSGRFGTIRTVIFLLAGKFDFSKPNPNVAR